MVPRKWIRAIFPLPGLYSSNDVSPNFGHEMFKANEQIVIIYTKHMPTP